MYKKLLKALIIAGLVALTFGSLPAFAEDDSFSISADVGVFSQYVWRGYALSDESVVIQPSVTLGYDGFGLNIWGNFDSDNYAESGTDYNETDFTLSYDKSFEVISLGLGYIYYDLEDQDTQEFYLSVSFEGYLNPCITFYKDVQAFEGWYVNLGVSHSYETIKGIVLDVSASMGYYDLDEDPNGKLHDGNISVSTTLPINDKFSMTPYLGYSFGLSGRANTRIINDSIGNKSNKDHFVGGFTCSYSFK